MTTSATSHTSSPVVAVSLADFEDISLTDPSPVLPSRPGPLSRNSFLGPSRAANLSRRSLAVPSRSGLLPTPASTPASTRTSTSISPATKSRTAASSPAQTPSLTPTSKFPPTSTARLSASGWKRRHRRTQSELEREYDLHDGDDDVPTEVVMWNIPLSPRPCQDRLASVEETDNGSDSQTKTTASSVVSPTIGYPDGQSRSSPPGASVDSNVPDDSIVMTATPTPPPTTATTTTTSSPGTIASRSTTAVPKSGSWRAAFASMSADTRSLTHSLEEHATQAESSDHDIHPTTSGGAGQKAKLPPLRHHTDPDANDPAGLSRLKAKALGRTRPSWLPPKSPREERRHLQEWRRMMAEAAARDRARKSRDRARVDAGDDARSELIKRWQKDVLPAWRVGSPAAVDNLLSQPATRELWWAGIPPLVRGEVWQRAIGNDLQLTTASFEAALDRTRARWSADQISRLTRLTDHAFADLNLFGPGCVMHTALMDVLMAYAGYRTDVIFPSPPKTDDENKEVGCVGPSRPVVQLHRIAALLLLVISTPSAAFIALANVLNRPAPLSYLVNDGAGIGRSYSRVLGAVAYKRPQLGRAIVRQLPGGLAGPVVEQARQLPITRSFTPLPEADVGAGKPGVSTRRMTENRRLLERAIDTLFSSMFTAEAVLSVDCAARVWDVYVFEGEAAFVRAGVAVLLACEGAISDLFDQPDGDCRPDGLFEVARRRTPLSSGQKHAVAIEDDNFSRLLRDAGKAALDPPRSAPGPR